MKNYRLTKYVGNAAAPPINTELQMPTPRDAIRLGDNLLFEMQEAAEGYYDLHPNGKLIYRILDRQHRLLAKIESA